MISLLTIEYAFIIILWAGLVGHFLTCTSVFKIRNMWLMPACYFMFSTPLAMVMNVGLGIVSLMAATVLVTLWSVTNIK